MTDLQGNYDELKTWLNRLENKSLERNLIFSGIPENRWENDDSRVNTLYRYIADTMSMEILKRSSPEQAALRLKDVKDWVQGMKTEQDQLGLNLLLNTMLINSMKADSTWRKVCLWIVNTTRKLNVSALH